MNNHEFIDLAIRHLVKVVEELDPIASQNEIPNRVLVSLSADFLPALHSQWRGKYRLPLANG